jgi:hypothetical protein
MMPILYHECHEDIAAAKEVYPFIVKRQTRTRLNLDIGQWITDNPAIDMAVITREVIDGPGLALVIEITYGFKKEEDAIAFKLKFGGR